MGERIDIPDGWEATGYFERIVSLCRPGALLETLPVVVDGKLRAARMSPREVFQLFRFVDMRDYLRLSAVEKAKQRKNGVQDFGTFYTQNVRHGHGRR